MKKIILLFALATTLLACCTTKNTTEAITEGSTIEETIDSAVDTTKQHLLGGDRDEHGCIPSAGYLWCEELQECIRPWETPCDSE